MINFGHPLKIIQVLVIEVGASIILKKQGYSIEVEHGPSFSIH